MWQTSTRFSLALVVLLLTASTRANHETPTTPAPDLPTNTPNPSGAFAGDVADFLSGEEVPDSAEVTEWAQWLGQHAQEVWSANAESYTQMLLEASTTPKQVYTGPQVNERIYQALKRLGGKIVQTLGKETSEELIRNAMNTLRAASALIESPEKDTVYTHALSALSLAAQITHLELRLHHQDHLASATTDAIANHLDSMSMDARLALADALEAIDDADDPAITSSFLDLVRSVLEAAGFNEVGDLDNGIALKQYWYYRVKQLVGDYAAKPLYDVLVALGVPVDEYAYWYSYDSPWSNFHDLRPLRNGAKDTTLRVIESVEEWLLKADEFLTTLSIEDMRLTANKFAEDPPRPSGAGAGYSYYDFEEERAAYYAKDFAGRVLRAWSAHQETFEGIKASTLQLIRGIELMPLEAATNMALHSAQGIKHEDEVAELNQKADELGNVADELRSTAESAWQSFYKAATEDLAAMVYDTGLAIVKAVGSRNELDAFAEEVAGLEGGVGSSGSSAHLTSIVLCVMLPFIMLFA